MLFRRELGETCLSWSGQGNPNPSRGRSAHLQDRLVIVGDEIFDKGSVTHWSSDLHVSLSEGTDYRTTKAADLKSSSTVTGFSLWSVQVYNNIFVHCSNWTITSTLWQVDHNLLQKFYLTCGSHACRRSHSSSNINFSKRHCLEKDGLQSILRGRASTLLNFIPVRHPL